MTPGRNLVVGAAPDALRQLIGTLRAAGYRVQEEANGADLLDRVVDEMPDGVLIDESVAGLAPVDIISALTRDATPVDVPVMVFLGDGRGEAAPVLRAGAADCLRTPFDLQEALARIDSHVERGRLIRQARQDAATRAIVLDIVRDVTATLSVEEIFDILVRRVARLFKIDRCSMILLDERGRRGTIVAAHDDPNVGGVSLDLHRYPEIRHAVARDEPVLVDDLHSSSLFDEIRPLWESEGIKVNLRSIAAIPFTFEAGRRGVFLIRSGPDEPALDERSVQLASAIIQGAARALSRAAAFKSVLSHREQLEVLAKTDELTGCLSRRHLSERLEQELERATRYQRLLAIAMIDIDHFKRLNDTLGHTRGDAALRTIGAVLRRSLRSADFVGRYGGDEFLMVLPETTLNGAHQLAERIREGIARRTFDFRGRKMNVTVSGGVASYPDSGIVSAEEFIDLADQALYRAKWEGRDKVIAYSSRMSRDSSS